MGLVTTSAEDNWKDAQYECIATVAAQEGFELMQFDVLRTQNTQIEAVRALIVYGVDVIVFCPIVQAGWDIVLLEAQNAGIPVIAYVNNVVTTQDVLENLVTMGTPVPPCLTRMLKVAQDTVDKTGNKIVQADDQEE